MGYWGWIIVAKGDDALAAHPAVTAFGGEVMHENAMGPWREMWTSTGDITPDADIAAVVSATGAPAMVFSVMDDDCAVGEIAIPSGERWVTVFREDILAESPGAVPEDYQRTNAVAGARRWAAVAGLTADPEKVEHALAVGWMDDFYDAVGIPGRT